MVYSTYAKNCYYGSLSIEETTAIDSYLEMALQEDVLLESKASDIKNILSSITNKLKNGEDAKQEIDELKRYVSAAKKDGDIKTIILIGSMIGSWVGIILGFAYIMKGMYTISSIWCIISIICTCITHLTLNNNTTESDKIYNTLLKQESIAMKKLRIAKENDNKDEIKIYQAVIDGCEKAKETRKEALRTYNKKKPQNESADVLLEYKGNEIKNYTFVQVLEDVDKLMFAFRTNIEQTTQFADNMLSRFSKVKTSGNLNELLASTDSEIKDWDKDDSAMKNQYGPLTWGLLNKYARKFSTKYSEMGLTTRENFEKRLQNHLEFLKKEKDKYKDYKKKLEDAYQKAVKLDYTNAQKMHDRIVDIVNYGMREINATIKDIVSVIDTLKVDRLKTSLLYNILNKNKNDYTVANKAKK